MEIVPATVAFQRGTAATATANNKTLFEGVPGWEMDTGKFKIGDGVTSWNGLPYHFFWTTWTRVEGKPTTLAGYGLTVNNDDWSGADLAMANGGTGASSASAARANLGLVIDADVQAYHANLAALSGLTLIADRLPYASGAGTLALATFTSQGRSLLGQSKLTVSDDTPFGTGSNVYTSGTNTFSLGTTGTGFFLFYQNSTLALTIDTSRNTRPGADNTYNLGTAALRWKEVFSATGVIATSDERAKQDIGAVPSEWLDAWGDVEWCRFRFNDAVAVKGAAARWHVGLIAQRVRDAFVARGLDPFALGLLCYDAWETEQAPQDDGGVLPLVEAGDRYSLRYDECLAMEAAWARRELALLRATLAK